MIRIEFKETELTKIFHALETYTEKAKSLIKGRKNSIAYKESVNYYESVKKLKDEIGEIVFPKYEYVGDPLTSSNVRQVTPRRKYERFK